MKIYLLAIIGSLLQVGMLSAQEINLVNSGKLTANSSANEVYDFVSEMNNKQSQRLSMRNKYLYKLDSTLYTSCKQFEGCTKSKISFYHDTISVTKQIREIGLSEGQSSGSPKVWLPNLFFARYYNLNSGSLERESVNYWRTGLSTRWDETYASIVREYIYDDDGKLERYNAYTFLEQAAPPIFHFYNYDSLDLLSSVDVYRNDTVNFIGKFRYIHNNQGQLIEAVRHYLQPSFGVIPADSVIYNYFDYGNLESELTYIYFNPFYDIHEKDAFIYNDDGSIEEKRFYMGLGEWDTKERSDYHYYSDGSLEYIDLFDVSDEDYSMFLESYRYSYNHDISADVILFPKIFSYRHDAPNIKMLTEYSRKDLWEENTLDIDYFYSSLDVTNNISTTKSNSLSIFPNPVSNKIKIDYDSSHGKIDLTLYDIKGSLIKVFNQISPEQEVDVSMLDSGIYFFRVEGMRLIESGKFLKL